jgi:hypothetical protein
MSGPFGVIKELHDIDGVLTPFVEHNGVLRRVAAAPLPGSQALFLACSEQLCLYAGPRGCGKTRTLLMDAGAHIGLGMGPECRMLFFRETFPQLAEPWAIARELFTKIWPDIRFNETAMTATWPAGEQLMFRPVPTPEVIPDIKGKNLVWAGCDELADFEDMRVFLFMLSVLRGVHPRLPQPLHLRASTNTFGRNSQNVMELFKLTRLPQPMYGPLIPADEFAPARRCITGNRAENLPLLKQNPTYYESQIAASAAGNSALKDAWINAVWAEPETAYFGEVDWSAVTIPADIKVGSPGRIRFSLDWGLADPNAILAFYPSKGGEEIALPDGGILSLRRGDIVFLDEIYTGSRPDVGMRLAPYEIADRIKALVEKHGWDPRILRANGNVADGQIFEGGRTDARSSVADDLEKAGIIFERADKSRIAGASRLLAMLMAAGQVPRDQPAVYFSASCVNALRSIPNLERDPDDPSDVLGVGDCHMYDSARYAVQSRGSGLGTVSTRRRWIA